jgi:hypothetical protein
MRREARDLCPMASLSKLQMPASGESVEAGYPIVSQIVCCCVMHPELWFMRLLWLPSSSEESLCAPVAEFTRIITANFSHATDCCIGCQTKLVKSCGTLSKHLWMTTA